MAVFRKERISFQPKLKLKEKSCPRPPGGLVPKGIGDCREESWLQGRP